MREQAITSRSDLAVRSLTPELAEPLRRDAEARLWIFCHTLDLRMAVYLATHIRRFSPESRLLLLKNLQHAGFEELLFHRVISVGESEGIFLDAVTELALSA